MEMRISLRPCWTLQCGDDKSIRSYALASEAMHMYCRALTYIGPPFLGFACSALSLGRRREPLSHQCTELTDLSAVIGLRT